jgi:hypothetical protein
MFRSDQLNHSSSCSVLAGFQSHLSIQHILQRSITTKGVPIRQVIHWILNEFTSCSEHGLMKKQ